MKTWMIVAVVSLMTSVGWSDDTGKISVGQTAPDFEVTDSNGKQLKLSDRLKAGKHVAIMFSRANW